MGGKSSSTVVGYKYSFGIHMGMGRGPIDQLVAIRVGDRQAWPLSYQINMGTTEMEDGSLMPIYITVPPVDPVTDNQLILINAPTLFGGEKKEGGIVGFAAVLMGAPTQPVNLALAGMLGTLIIPAWRGVTTLFYQGLVATLNPYPKPWKFRVRRALKGWFQDRCWYPEKAVIFLCDDIYAMNPAHILYEAATNPDWGRGLPANMINEDSFVAAANKLADECFGLCLKWSRENDIDAFVNQVINHIGGAIFPDRRTGKLTLRLLRDDYQVSQLPVFDYSSGLTEIKEEDGTSSEPLKNEIVVKWRDPVTDDARSDRVQNIASLQQMGAASSETADYPGIPTQELALRVAQRDLRAKGLPLKRYKITLDRRGADITPGMPFVISSPQDGINTTIVRAGRIEDSTQNPGEIVITAVQDVFGLPNVSYIEPQPPGTGTIQPPEPPVFYRAIEVPYGDIARYSSAADLDYLPIDAGYMLMMAAKPNDFAINFKIWTTLGIEVWTDRGTGDWSPHGLSQPFDEGARSITLESTSVEQLISVGEAFMIGEEILRINAYDATTHVASVSRGCYDTIPTKHGSESVYAYQHYNGRDRREYVVGDTPKGRFATVATAGTIAPLDAPEASVTMNRRAARPYAPGQVKVNGSVFYTHPVALGEMIVTWADRNRKLQDDRLVGHDEAAFTPETGQTHTIVIRKASDQSVLRTVTGLTGGTWTYNAADATTDGDVEEIIVELFAVRDTYESWQKYSFPVRHLPADATGYGLNYSENYGA